MKKEKAKEGFRIGLEECHPFLTELLHPYAVPQSWKGQRIEGTDWVFDDIGSDDIQMMQSMADSAMVASRPIP